MNEADSVDNEKSQSDDYSTFSDDDLTNFIQIPSANSKFEDINEFWTNSTLSTTPRHKQLLLNHSKSSNKSKANSIFSPQTTPLSSYQKSFTKKLNKSPIYVGSPQRLKNKNLNILSDYSQDEDLSNSSYSSDDITFIDTPIVEKINKTPQSSNNPFILSPITHHDDKEESYEYGISEDSDTVIKSHTEEQSDKIQSPLNPIQNISAPLISSDSEDIQENSKPIQNQPQIEAKPHRISKPAFASPKKSSSVPKAETIITELQPSPSSIEKVELKIEKVEPFVLSQLEEEDKFQMDSSEIKKDESSISNDAEHIDQIIPPPNDDELIYDSSSDSEEDLKNIKNIAKQERKSKNEEDIKNIKNISKQERKSKNVKDELINEKEISTTIKDKEIDESKKKSKSKSERKTVIKPNEKLGKKKVPVLDQNPENDDKKTKPNKGKQAENKSEHPKSKTPKAKNSKTKMRYNFNTDSESDEERITKLVEVPKQRDIKEGVESNNVDDSELPIALRRRTRIKVKPLKFWCGEHIVYGLSEDGFQTFQNISIPNKNRKLDKGEIQVLPKDQRRILPKYEFDRKITRVEGGGIVIFSDKAVDFDKKNEVILKKGSKCNVACKGEVPLIFKIEEI